MNIDKLNKRIVRTVGLALIVGFSFLGSIGVNASISNQLVAPSPISVELNEESTFSAETEFAKQVLLTVKKFFFNRY